MDVSSLPPQNRHSTLFCSHARTDKFKNYKPMVNIKKDLFMKKYVLKIMVLVSVLILYQGLYPIFGQEMSTNDLSLGPITKRVCDLGTWTAPESTATVLVPPNQARRSIHYWGTPDNYLVLELKKPIVADSLILDVERWTSAPPFELKVEVRSQGQWRNILILGAKTPVGFGKKYTGEIGNTIDAIRFQLNSKKNLGILIHHIAFIPKGPMVFKGAELTMKQAEEPLVIAEDGKARPVELQGILIQTCCRQNPFSVRKIEVEFENADCISNMEVCLNDKILTTLKTPQEGKNSISLITAGDAARLTGNRDLLVIRAQVSSKAAVDKTVGIRVTSIVLGEQTITFKEDSLKYLFGVLIRDSGWDGVSGYRIPGLAISNKGTLLAVYDIRHKNHSDLPGDIDIGLSRSFDRGKTWQPMQVAMNRTGADETREGVGDPTILVDRETGRIWIAALWAHDGFSTEASKPGLKLGSSGQLDLVYSDDDGKTWSQPKSITAMAAPGKDWCILFQGPGMGITMRDGTLVMPAQFISKDRLWYSTIVWSRDHGKTWTAGNGARPGTCEAQVVELNDGSIMINMRNFKEHARSVAITKDLGKTWTEHPTSIKALPDPICQASLLRIASVKDGDSKNLIAFCNPYSDSRRINMSIQFSEDEGMTWKNRILLNKKPGYGYSCMALVDKGTLGVLYETAGGLIYQQVKW